MLVRRRGREELDQVMTVMYTLILGNEGGRGGGGGGGKEVIREGGREKKTANDTKYSSQLYI